MHSQKATTCTTPSGIEIIRTESSLSPENALAGALSRIDRHRGAVFSSGYEFPGRYSRREVGFTDPPVEFVAHGRRFVLRALNGRGEQILHILEPDLGRCREATIVTRAGDRIEGFVEESREVFAEEDRSRQPTVFSVVRQLCRALNHSPHGPLGFYGACGHDLVLQFEPLVLRHSRTADQPDLHLFLPDELVVIDRQKETAVQFSYEFARDNFSTSGLPRETEVLPPPRRLPPGPVQSDHATGAFADKVRRVRDGFFRGDYFEVTLSQTFSRPYSGSPSQLFARIRETNPSPYEFLLNLGKEQLVGASPEMFVRVEGRRVETCPIAGTARRPESLMEEAAVIRELLHSRKDEAELTMCSDVDRNDKARVCEPGSVRVIGRRQIETYSKLFHTVDHIEGMLREDCDGFDALLSHMWACTLTGAPKPAALQAIEDVESGPREWYGGCVGMLLANGDVNTGITIRTVNLRDGIARVRAGATLLADSDPEAEEIETRVKASAFLDALTAGDPTPCEAPASRAEFIRTGEGKRVLFVDHRDSFVHTLASYVRQTGAEVRTYRAGFDTALLDRERPDLVFLSPGPGSPAEFGVAELVRACVDRGLPVFGVCLGLQGIVEAFGGRLGQLPYPVHGKPSTVTCEPGGLFEGFGPSIEVGRYHSLYAIEEALPECLRISARTEDGVIMAIEHRSLPVGAVQFHPESIMSLKGDLGMRLIARVMEHFATRRPKSSLVKPVAIRDVVTADR